ncbi:MAG: MBL fold metallo-hydrolase [Elusimicrobia bacterium]|nr:MBL fold metallo-hydrolase [Elusimicrobiota bacterium]
MPAPVIAIDCRYLGRPGYAASYLLVEGGRALFVDNNTARALPRLLESLQAAGLGPEQVDYAVVTHAHLDHAAGSQALLDACPNATLLAHPKAAGHIIDPARLEAGARKVYGDQAFEELYGSVGAVPAARVRAMADGEVLRWGSRELTFLHTRGHANHHMCVWDPASEGAFTGDSFGLAYPALQGRGLFIFPSTSPTGYEPEEARTSVERLVKTGARRAFLSHFGEVADLRPAAEQLLGHLDFSARLLESAAASGLPDAALTPFCEAALREHFRAALRERGLDAPETWELLKLDLELNAAGIAHAARRKRAPAPGR